jgi:hypothetical protein
MTGRDKIQGAFAPEGTPEIGVVAAYEGIFLRDHYAALTKVPWWDAARADARAKDFSDVSGLDWFAVDACSSRAERARQCCELRADGVWRVDRETGQAKRLSEPTPGGVNTSCATSKHTDVTCLPAAEAQIDALIPRRPEFDRNRFLSEGRHDAATSIRQAVDAFLYSPISSPLWSLYGLFGYEGMMMFLADSPCLAAYAGQRILENTRQRIRMISALGADAVWIEECLTDQISPELFQNLNVPLLRQCVQEIRACGMKSIYYYCGNPHDRLNAILDVGADAIHFEEGKKGFAIDIADIVRVVKGRCVVFGNLDAIGVLQQGSEQALRFEIQRQLKAGRENGNRFVMSTGSPITPETTVERVRRYADMVRGGAMALESNA